MGSARAFLDPFWANLGSVWAILGQSWVSLEPFWSHLGASSGHPRAILKPSWAAKGQGRRGKQREEQRLANSAKIARRPGESTVFHVLGRHVEAFLGQFWGILGSSWALGAVLGPSVGLLGPSWAYPGASWAQLGASWGQLRGHVVPKWRSYWFLHGFCWFLWSQPLPSTPACPRLVPGLSPACPRLVPGFTLWGLGKSDVFHKNLHGA